MADETLGVLTLLVGAMGTVLAGIQILKPVTVTRAQQGNSELPLSMRISRSSPVVDIVDCPNCGQPFDAAWSASYNVETVRVNGTRIVSCPRCWYTFEA